MARDDVDFVVGDEVPRDVSPGDPSPGGPRRPRRRWLVLGAAVVVLAGVVGTVRSLTDDTTDAQTASSSSPTPSASATRLDRDSSTALDPSRAVATPLVTPTARLGCPEFVACKRSTTIPAALVRAVRARFPTARPVSGQTVLLTRDNVATAEVRARLVVFRIGAVELYVRVSTPGSDEDGGAVPVNTRTVIRTAATGQYVTIEVAAQNGVPIPGYDVLQQLVGDSRLLAT